MDNETLIKQANRIIVSGRNSNASGALAEAMEFIRVYAGEKSAFYKSLCKMDQSWTDVYLMKSIEKCMQAYIRYVENGLSEGISIERKAQIDVVSDF